MCKKIVLIGAGGFGREVAIMIEEINLVKKRFELLGFLDDGPNFDENSDINGYPWLGPTSWILDHKDDVVCTCTISNPAIKSRIQRELTDKGVRFQTIMAVTSGVARSSVIGPGSVLYWNVGVSVNCKVGAGVLLNDGVKLGHDVVIGDFVSVFPGTGISGGTTVGEEASIGGHAFIVPGKKIGDRAHIAAGSIVFSNVRAGTTVLGNPAKRMKELE